MWGLFVVGHDCGHRSFSANDTINNIFGTLSHIPLLVPYHSWRVSHGLHHKNHGNIDRDEAYSAVTEQDYKDLSPVTIFFRYHAYLIYGWTLYLVFGMPRHFRSHYSFKSTLYLESSETDKAQIAQSIYFFWAFFLVLVTVVPYYLGISFLFTYYFGAYTVFGAWISMVTHFHHTHPDAPWYRSPEWDYQRGALTTINRDYGIVEHIHHNVGTHTVHHYFTRIPHYNLREADRAIRPVLGDYYKRSEISAIATMKIVWQMCRFVPDKGNVVYYRGDPIR
jgi:omega-3 fatty acid desaturase (delta-15 desaturase)